MSKTITLTINPIRHDSGYRTYSFWIENIPFFIVLSDFDLRSMRCSEEDYIENTIRDTFELHKLELPKLELTII